MAKMTGGCQCGAVRYTLDDAPEAVFVCHCTDCRKQTSSAFALVAVIPEDQFHLDQGEVRTFEGVAASGRAKRQAFCPSCGSRIWHRIEWRPGKLSIRAGTLDNPGVLEPSAHLWTSQKLPWVVVPDGVTTYDTQPG